MITSTSNERIKYVTSVVKNTKARRKEGVFVVEGEKMVQEIPSGILLECFVSEDFTPSAGFDPAGSLGQEPVVVSAGVFKKMSDTTTPQGILCLCRQDRLTLSDLLSQRDKGGLKLLILEGIQDPGNLGTMIRTAEGAGFDAVIADENTVDVYNPKTIRSTMGSLFRVPVITVPDLYGAVSDLKRSSVTVYAAALDAMADFREEEYGMRLAFLIGNEGNGLSAGMIDAADRTVKIPMKGKLESLNAAVAAAILMYSV
ncbi:MAG: RNA methyltransferase [Lachnospiraceae bacterium]|nr:RNA methyltransferase [Lachnospiraceae bacterium]MBR4573701.1 RNA methyltransferase [Lachnospiraceae bacterium]